MHRAQTFAELIQGHHGARQLGHGIQSFIDRIAFQQRPGQPMAQQAGSHGRARLIEHSEEGVALAAGAGVVENLQIGQGGLVQPHHALGAVGVDLGDVGQVALLGLLQVRQQRTRGPQPAIEMGHAEPVEVGRAEMSGKPFVGSRGIEPGAGHPFHGRWFLLRVAEPFGEPRFQSIQGAFVLLVAPLGQQQLAGTEPHQEFLHPLRMLGVELRRLELARGKIDQGQSGRLAAQPGRQGGQIDVSVRVDQVVRDGRARRYHAHHFPPNEPLGLGRVFHLLGDSHLHARRGEFVQVLLEGMIGHAAHGHGVFAVLVAGRERDLENLRRPHRVFAEHLVEIPRTKKQDAVRIFLFQRVELTHHRRIGLHQTHGTTPIGL